MADLARLAAFRHSLHRAPEISGEEAATAAAVVNFTADTRPDQVLPGLGGHGVALVYDGAAPGPTVMLRAELDALPILDAGAVDWRSQVAGKGHLCGHDGHMAILCGVAQGLGAQRPTRGRVVVLFQPAEEDGSGAAAVLADPRFAEIAPDWAFSLHNLPGLALGAAVLCDGAANCASVGMKIALTGRTSHAAEPDLAISPARTIADLVPGLQALRHGETLEPGFRLVTLTHLRMGEPVFGITPGAGEVYATLRTQQDSDMAALKSEAVALADRLAAHDELGLHITWHDDFAASVNAPEAAAHLRAALAAEGITLAPARPMKASEDFGRFGAVAPCAMVWIGAGENHPPLHAPDYDFPDALIGPGLRVFRRILADLLG